MKTNINLNKSSVISHFLANYEKFEWERQENGGDLTTHINNYKYILSSNREGHYLHAVRDGERLVAGSIDSNDFPQVKELRDKVWDLVSKRKEDIKWKYILNDLLNGCDSERDLSVSC